MNQFAPLLIDWYEHNKRGSSDISSDTAIM